jgi:DNA-directed RNA polymerase subunit RPC12/RpoP
MLGNHGKMEENDQIKLKFENKCMYLYFKIILKIKHGSEKQVGA